ncbi:signal peptidase I [Amylibacter kogurei]|uniref:Signal peptidase I n=1 Tax=Paramylibacter kogurei TaxID=1889778 RepID=A0A2G5K2B2_9RHOB|nr:signal peptidase I [Amylibacter kogurei]PIB23259.1 signal peptidase I [Amylibacter kogurei]
MNNEMKRSDAFAETIKTVVYALLLAGVIRTLLFQPFWIPSGSMKNTLLIGDFLFVNKMAYGYSKYSCPWSLCPISGRIWAEEPEIGDIVVFKHPVTKVDFIKRLVGKPGDTVQMVDGILHLNGKAVPQQEIGTFVETNNQQGPMRNTPRCTNNPVAVGGDCEKELLKETLPNGVEHTILNIGQSYTDQTPLYTVPEGQYFFMGDNRDNSGDSRIPANVGGVGFVPFENLVGRADRVIFSSAGSRILAFWTWRKDRFFKALD